MALAGQDRLGMKLHAVDRPRAMPQAHVEEFKAHILGVLENVIGTQRNLILARLEGGPLANTGVIAGMSGSPVYIDGRLVGAVSYSLGQFATEPIAGITPIAEMIDAASLATPRPQAARVDLPIPFTTETLRASLKQAFSCPGRARTSTW